jgi:uncharacterized repeat protein (TIGR03803 family)
MLFGMTAQGGANNDGTLFQINTNGSGYGILQNSGMNTWGSDSLMVQGSTLYGMIYSSSVAGNGAIFSMNTNGSAFTVFHTFSGPSGDGWLPMGGVTWVNGTLYGMTTYGGGGNVGTMFAISASGSGYSVLYSFDAGTSDGFSPYGALTFSGDTLFGTTYLGGTYNLGTAFSVNTNGTPYSVLHVFAGGRTDGLNPSSGLTLSGPTLFGTTHDWFGQIFSINEDGSGFSIVEGGSSVANYDVGTPVVLGSAIYNTSPSPNGYGDVFSLNTDGSGLQVLHTFQGGAADGAGPGDLICLGSTLFGVTASGGSTNNLGTIFKINTDGSGYSILHVFNGGANDSATPTGALTPFGGSLYGLTSAGGIFVISTNGTGFSILHTFSGLDGSGPVGSLTLFGPTLYGMTSSGGINGLGTIFEINTNGTEFAVLHHFSGAPSDGAQPAASLTLATSMLYGMTEFGGSDNGGVIFSLPTGLAPVLAPWPSTNINELVLWQYTPAVTGTGYTFGLSNAPSGMTVGSASGTISWTPTQTQATYTYSNIAYVVYQSGHPIAATGFTVTVNDINMAPAFEYVIGPQTVYAATPLTITDMATNTDIWATSLAYAVVSAPAGVGIDPNTGVVTWTPTIGQAGTNTITVSATDTDPYAVNARNLSTTNSFLVIVIATSPPSFVQTPTDQVIAFGQGFSFSALATGSPPPSYQWQFSTDGLNYTNLVGETAASYQTLSSSLTNIGFYRAVAANLAGTNTSAAASLSFLNAELLPVLILYGPVGADYTIQSKPALTGSSNWISVTNITLPASQPYIYVDPSSLTNRQQFYRALPQ